MRATHRRPLGEPNQTSPKFHAVRFEAAQESAPRVFGPGHVLLSRRGSHGVIEPARCLDAEIFGKDPTAILDERAVGFVLHVAHSHLRA